MSGRARASAHRCSTEFSCLAAQGTLMRENLLCHKPHGRGHMFGLSGKAMKISATCTPGRGRKLSPS